MGDFNWDEYVVEVNGRRYVDEEMVQAQLAAARDEAALSDIAFDQQQTDLEAARAENERLQHLVYVPGHEPNEDGKSETWAEAFADTDMLRKEAEAEAAAERGRAERAEGERDSAEFMLACLAHAQHAGEVHISRHIARDIPQNSRIVRCDDPVDGTIRFRVLGAAHPADQETGEE
jgi:hypothetical protein